VRRHFFLLSVVALIVAPGARAHAIPVASEPTNGSVLASAPSEVVVRFDSPVQTGTRNAVVRNADGASVQAGRARISRSQILVIPLQSGLHDGTYTVRWSIVSDDGHDEEGVIAFAVGSAHGAVRAVLKTRGSVAWQRLAMKTLFLFGVLVAAGAVFFALAVLRPLGLEHELTRPQTDILFVAFLAALSGSEALLHLVAGEGTRFAHVLEAAAGSSAAGAVAAVLTPAYHRVRFLAWAAAATLLICPPLAGHALDAGQRRVLSPLADIVHLGGAAVWLGGLVSLAYTLGRAKEEARVGAARRFAVIALGAVVVVMATGPLRALTEFSSWSQLWSTGYGRAVLVKTAFLVLLIGLAWLNRSRLAEAFSRLRRLVIVELLLLTGVVVTVATLTELPPGRAHTGLAGALPAPLALAEAPVPPPATAFVDARRAGRLVVGFARRGQTVTVTLVGSNGKAPSNVDIAINGPPAHGCGPGCFRAKASGRSVVVRVDLISLRFDTPAQLTPAAALLRRATRAFNALQSVVVDERIAAFSRPTKRVRIVYRAPDRSSTEVVGAGKRTSSGEQTIVIGTRRWDRFSGKGWVASSQTPARVPRAVWSSGVRNVYYSGSREITFFDPRASAWFRLEVDARSARPLRLLKIAPGRVVSDRFSAFDQPARISPPRG
jgi:copper transport protein